MKRNLVGTLSLVALPEPSDLPTPFFAPGPKQLNDRCGRTIASGRFSCTKLAVLLALLSVSPVAAFAATGAPPKVVFIGDQYTANWPFPANSGWINEGNPATGYWNSIGSSLLSPSALSEFQSAVVSQHPAIVHIMVGSNDIWNADDAGYTEIVPRFVTSITAMVQEAKAANIQVILGNIPNEGPTGGSLAMEMNDWLDAYGAGNGIQVINYSDALCGCVGSVGSGAANWSIGSTTQPVLYGATIPVTPTTPEGGTLPTAAGFALMTELAQTAIANLTATLKSGYLQDVEYPGPDETSEGGVNVNTVNPGSFLQFTPIGQYSDGSTHPQLNTTFAGASGTWTSSNPQVMSVSQTGRAASLTPGTAVIKYTAPNGVQFSEWIMYVGDNVP
jgi:Bacterial Ig-like domain (group 2)